MFLVEDRPFGAVFAVFSFNDPRKDGYVGEVVEGATLDYDMQEVHEWAEGQDAPEPSLGQSPDNPKEYKVFTDDRQREAAGYHRVAATPVEVASWPHYVQLHLYPPDPTQTTDVQWFDYSDRVDERSRQRRKQAQTPNEPASASRDDVAHWLAKEHFIVDGGIREVWYLPEGSPDDEIRLLELSDRLPESGTTVEPFEIAVEVPGKNFRLLVADMTSDQLEQVKQDPSRLPPGWSLRGNKTWERRGA